MSRDQAILKNAAAESVVLVLKHMLGGTATVLSNRPSLRIRRVFSRRKSIRRRSTLLAVTARPSIRNALVTPASDSKEREPWSSLRMDSRIASVTSADATGSARTFDAAKPLWPDAIEHHESGFGS